MIFLSIIIIDFPSKGRSMIFSNLKVYMAYGFEVKIDSDEFTNLRDYLLKRRDMDTKTEVLERKKKYVRDGWSSSYQLNSEFSEIIKVDLDTIEQPLNTFEIRPSKSSKRWYNNDPLEIKFNRTYTLRKDGVGCITLCFSLENKENSGVAEILRILNLSPRTRLGNFKKPENDQEKDSEVVENDFNERQPNYFKKTKLRLSKKARKYFDEKSLPFKLFIKTVIEDIPSDIKDRFKKLNIVWEEIYLQKDHSNDKPLYGDLKNPIEPQIPYCFVWAEMPSKEYSEAFLETKSNVNEIRSKRKIYTKDIAAIIGKWINTTNLEHASLDYWEQLGIVKDNVFLSQYMNSLVFTTYSGLVTLSIYPKLEGENNIPLKSGPIILIRESIIRCIEYSRMRWHQAICLNRELDILARAVAKEKDTRYFLPHLRYLIKIEEKFAIHLEDPHPAFWDSSVGSRLAEFLHLSIIERIESELSNKINTVKHLIDSKLSIVKTEDYIAAIIDENKT